MMGAASGARQYHEGARDADAVVGSWPRGVSRQPVLAIGQVVKILSREFPATTVSKVRFLEEKGLVSPQRSASGYRKYSQADVERIRYVLAKQRDSYVPLAVIGEELAALDAGHDVEPVSHARLISSDGVAVMPPTGRTVTARELAELSGCTRDQLEQYVKSGLIAPDMTGRFTATSVRVVRLISDLVASGIPPRNLRSVRNGAERSADIVDQYISSSSRRDRPGDKERARAQADEIAELFGSLHVAFLQVAMEATAD